MYIAAGHHDNEVRLSLEAAVDLANGLHEMPDGPIDVRGLLVAHGFTRAPDASEASLQRVEARLRTLLPNLRSLAADHNVSSAVAWLNDALRTIPFQPWLTSHHDAPLHIHWTHTTCKFDDQVIADMLMAIAQEIVDHGTTRFGLCGADDCSHLFYDTTRNRSRRFCSNPRCASRTHTADHRARRRSGTSP